MKRFAVVEHDGVTDFPPDIHKLLRNYHWEQLDTEHVIALCDVHAVHIDELGAHPKVLLMPSLYSSQNLGTVAARRNKQAHLVSLNQRMAVEDFHSAWDLADFAQQHFGQKFALDV